MAQFRFIGDPRDNGRGAEPMGILGLSFVRDEWTTVPDDLAERLDSHSHLERKAEAKPRKAAALAALGEPYPEDKPAASLVDSEHAPPSIVAGFGGQPHRADPVFERGAAAKADGKKRNVPPAYRGKPEEARWLAGYDGAA